MNKNQRIDKEYSIGLDIGTASVGWAVIGNDYKLKRQKRQNMWGARLFSSANPAADRRGFRSSRRRLDRRKQRLSLLREFFAPEISKVDPVFFMRMKESMLHSEDKSSELNFDANILFADKFMTDKDYKEKYPTIYHLRSELFHSKEKQDIRLVYLALHHILKYRGNFLIEGNTKSIIQSSDDTGLDNLITLLGGNAAEIRKQIKEYVLDTTRSRSQRKDMVMAELNVDSASKKRREEILKASLGMKWSAKNFGFIGEDYDIDGEFSSANYDEKRDEIESALGDNYEMIAQLEAVYNWTVFSQYIVPNGCLSDVMIERYNEYAKDLAGLKKLYKKYAPAKYGAFFRNAAKGLNNYAAYNDLHGSVNDIQELYKTIRKDLVGVDEGDSNWKRFDERSKLGGYLKRQRMRDNGSIPHQIHQYELEAIIYNQAEYYPFLKDNRDKIIKIHEFRLPYYVGPLNAKSQFAWSVRKNDGKILPWNFDEKIDDIASAEAFITRMTNRCTYLPDEDVLPKNSLLYQEFEVRNELANIRVGGKRLNAHEQNAIYEALFVQNGGTVTHKKVLDFLKASQTPIQGGSITGAQKEGCFASQLKSYHAFSKIGIAASAENRKMVEQLIKWVTLFEDKKILKKKIKLEYGDVLTEEQIATITKFTLSGWGRLSEKLIDGLTNHSHQTVAQVMRETGKNFMQVAQSEKSEFKDIIEKEAAKKFSGRISYDDIQKLAGSPAIKRGLNQAVKIIDEIEDIMGVAPKLISIEMARNEDEKIPTSPRKKQLEKMYKDLSSDEQSYNKQIIVRELKEHDKKLDQKKFYLYFLQNGKCAYTGKPIDIDHLELCEIDHIIPQSLTKDDSLDNTVLVLRSENQRKLNDYPIDDDIQSRQRVFWSILNKSGLMTNEKFARLTSRSAKSEYLGGFINRQLVETRQITKRLASMLTEKYDDMNTEVFTIRAGMSSLFRQWQDIPKCREINDFHHAKDAYLAVVLALFVKSEFKNFDNDYLYDKYREMYADGDNRKGNNDNFILRTLQKNHGELLRDVILSTMHYNDCLVTRKIEYLDSAFYKLNPIAKNAKPSIPLKEGLAVEKYGGYTGVNSAYSVVIRYTDTSRKTPVVKTSVVGVPIYAAGSRKKTADYLKREYGDNVEILLDRIGKMQKILRVKSRNGKDSVNEQFMAGSGEMVNARQLILPRDIEYAIASAKNGIPNFSEVDQNESNAAIIQRAEDRNSRREKILKGIDEFWDAYIEKLEAYYSQFGGEVDKVIASGEAYRVLAPEDKIGAVKAILPLTQARSGNADMSKFPTLKLGNRMGRMAGQTLKMEETDFVFESITGLRKRIVKGTDLIKK